MGYTRMECSFPCPCKRGTMVASWEEHDTWPQPNRYVDWAFHCDECEKTSCFAGFLSTYILSREDAKKLSELSSLQSEAQAAVKQFAVPVYEERWVQYVCSLPTTVAAHEAISRHSYEVFLENNRLPGWIDEEARSAFREDPKRCIDLMRVEDAEVKRLTEAVEAAHRTHDEFWESIPKTSLPFH